MSTLYHWNPETNEYVGSSTARENPREPGQFLLPANAVMDDPPPAYSSNQIPVREGNVWTIKSDFRGSKIWNKNDRSHRFVFNIGENILPEETLLAPLSEFDEWVTDAWVKNSAKELAKVKADKIKLINAYSDGITSAGFTYNLKLFSCSESVTRIASELLASDPSVGWSVTWYTKDYSESILLDKVELKNFLGAIRDYLQPIKAVEYSKISQVMNANTIAEVDVVDETTGWP